MKSKGIGIVSFENCLSFAADYFNGVNSSDGTGIVIKTIKKATAISIQAVQRWVKTAAGKSINVLLEHFGGDLGAMVFAVRRDGVPKRLRKLWGTAALQVT